MNTIDVVMTELDDAQISVRNFEYDTECARRRRNDAVLALVNTGIKLPVIAARLGVSRQAVTKMAAAAAQERLT